MDLGHGLSAVLFALSTAAVAIAPFTLGPDAVWSFWTAYILTRPLGASMSVGDPQGRHGFGTRPMAGGLNGLGGPEVAGSGGE